MFRSGRAMLTNHLEQEPEAHPGVVGELGMRSKLACPLEVDGNRRGVVEAVCTRPDAFREADLRFLEAAVGWVGLVLHRAELVERIAAEARREGRRQLVAQVFERLTPRQREIAALLAEGLSNRQVAQRLHLTEGTVANHVEHILQRLGAHNRAQAAALAAEYGSAIREDEAAAPADAARAPAPASAPVRARRRGSTPGRARRCAVVS